MSVIALAIIIALALVGCICAGITLKQSKWTALIGWGLFATSLGLFLLAIGGELP